MLSFFSSSACSPPSQSFYDLSINSIDGEIIDFKVFKGKSVLIVNVASYCGFTGQYKALEKLYNKYKEDLVIVGSHAINLVVRNQTRKRKFKTFVRKTLVFLSFLQKRCLLKVQNSTPCTNG